MSHPLFTPEALQMLQENNVEEMRAFCENLHPATVAEALDPDEFRPDEVWRILANAPTIRDQAAVFEYFPVEWQVELVNGTGRQHVARLIEQMSHDDRVDLMRKLPAAVQEQLLRLVDEADRRDIAQLVSFEEGTVGSLMTTDYARVPAHLDATEAIERLRQQAPDRETIYYVYVTDEQTHRLLGVVSLRDLILAPRHAPLRELMVTDFVSLAVSDPRERAAEQLASFDFLALPVLDDRGRLVGIVTHDDVIDVINQEATEALQKQAGVGTLEENYLEAGFLKVWYKRVGWLAVLFVAQQFTVNVMRGYEDAIDKLALLAAFVPLCMSVGGNAGSQAATLITRALALGHVRLGEWWRVARHELLVGLGLAVALGLMGLIRIWVFEPVGPPGTGITRGELTAVISLTVGFVCLWGTLLGSMLPILLKRVGFDPALASSPFIATASDLTAIFIYFNVARFFVAALSRP
jgi:magnesium transporter